MAAQSVITGEPGKRPLPVVGKVQLKAEAGLEGEKACLKSVDS